MTKKVTTNNCFTLCPFCGKENRYFFSWATAKEKLCLHYVTSYKYRKLYHFTFDNSRLGGFVSNAK